MNPGLLLVVSGPAGVGKGTIVRKMMENDTKFVFQFLLHRGFPEPTKVKEKTTTIRPENNLRK